MQKYVGNPQQSTILCIDSYENKIPTGHIFAPFFDRGYSFYGVIDILLQTDQLLNELHFPQSYETRRRFGNFDRTPDPALGQSDVQRGKLATFSLKVLFRQNATWQGTITWLESSRVEGFRSVLELIALIDSALSA